ncbi:MAG: non-ribosomal peptide synthetase, partial [bacterium]|nr:non-ribosomal peptide synthetase [bacterium]
PVEKKEYYPLSSAQKRMYILQQMEMNSTIYNMPQTIPLPQELDADKLEKTFRQLIRRHESLRTSFHMVNEKPVQRVHDNVDFAIDHFDLSAIHAGVAPMDGPEGLHIRPFDLTRAPLLRVGLAKTGNKRYLLFIDMHHIISDGLSHNILIKDFTALNMNETLEPLRIQYKDFSRWQNSRKENIKEQEAYWLKEFQGEIPVLHLPTDYPRPSIQSFEGRTMNFLLDTKDTAAILDIAESEGLTLFMMVLTLTTLFLGKVCRTEDVAIGTPTSGRRHSDLEAIMGMFVNTLVLRNQPNEEKTFLQFLREVKVHTLEALENQEYPFEDLVDNVLAQRDTGRNPLFDVMFVFQNFDTGQGDMSSLQISGQKELPAKTPGHEETPLALESDVFTQNTTKFDLTFNGSLSGDTFAFSIEYCSKLFNKDTIERFITYFNQLVHAAVTSPQ